MTQTRRLFFNVIASNARALYVMICGLLTGRWMLFILGHEDYGLLSLVGGLIAFITIFNSIFSSSVSRYYAYAVGASQKNQTLGLQDCRSWFNVALFIHFIIPIVLLLIGYPLGVCAIQYWLTIAPNKVDACLWIFRFSCISCFVGLFSVPFRAMYIAKQYIAELTIYTFITTTLHLFALYYMATHPSDWLIILSFWMMLQVVLPMIMIIIRAYWIFPECKINFKQMIDISRIRQLFTFAGWQFFANFGSMLQTQSNSILINQFLGATFNSSNTVATTVSGHAQMLSNEIDGAFLPAITNQYGAKNYSLAHKLAYRSSKYSVLLILLLILPLTLEMPKIINLWLMNPPPLVVPLCICTCWVCVINKLTSGQWMLLSASGEIARLQFFSFFTYLVAPLIVGISFYYGASLLWLGYALILAMVSLSLTRLVCAQRKGISIVVWFNSVFKPIFIVSIISLTIGLLVKSFFEPSILRLFIVGGSTCGTLVITAWFFVMSQEEKKWVLQKLSAKFKRKEK